MEMNFLRKLARCSRLEKIIKNVIREKMNIKTSVLDYIRYKQLHWYGHLHGRRKAPQKNFGMVPAQKTKKGKSSKLVTVLFVLYSLFFNLFLSSPSDHLHFINSMFPRFLLFTGNQYSKPIPILCENFACIICTFVYFSYLCEFILPHIITAI